MRKTISYGRHFIDEDDIRAVLEVLRSDFLTQGPKVQEFEERLAAHCGAGRAVVFNSGTSALHAAYNALGLKEGDEFITSPITFAATANAGLYLGAVPVFVDTEKDTGNMDFSELEKAVSPKTRLIVPVHYAGHAADMEKIRGAAEKRGIPVVEDACHALGGEHKGEKIGSCKYSDMTVFSFHPVKSITTGEGGAVLTNDETLYKKMLMFRSHGITREYLQNASDGGWYYEMQSIGFNYRMTDMQAALGVSQLRKLDRFIGRRREIAGFYDRKFNGNPYFDTPPERDYARSAWHLYPIRLKDKYMARRKDVFTKLREKGLGVNVHYIPVYLQPYYRGLGYMRGACPSAEDFYNRIISIPIYPAMTDEELGYASDTIIEVFEGL
ncbi:MAG: UDP-4-amino-4,6-dideoxy-N-acetyl-beta-L-altrosamine transaminase [Deltaproteobacteria bacterium]|nr:UDP-4-amino-4,6-dideoxy-N-acetyl-beta-L-altrosamine transaminase [Deltaproteobacteria bacterium]